MSPILAVPLFLQTLILVLRSFVPEASRLTTSVSHFLLFLAIVFISSSDSLIFPLGVNGLFLIPVMAEILFCSVLDSASEERLSKTPLLHFNELSVIVIFLILSNIAFEAKVALLIFSFVLDAYRAGGLRRSKKSQLCFFSSVLCAFLSMGLLIGTERLHMTHALLLLMAPITYSLFPFSLLKGSGEELSFKLGHRVLSIMLFTVFDRSLFVGDSVKFIVPALLIFAGIGLLNVRLSRIKTSGRFGIELFLFVMLANFPNLSAVQVVPSYLWVCFFLCIPKSFSWSRTKKLSGPIACLVYFLLFLGLIPGPFANLFTLVLREARLYGRFSLVLVFLMSYFFYVSFYFYQVLSRGARPSIHSEEVSTFSPFNSFLILSTIIIGVILSI